MVLDVSRKWEQRLRKVLNEVDRRLEETYGHRYPLHPARAVGGTAANPQYDGLFRLSADFTPGFGSELGRGYVFNVEMVTLERVPERVREEIEAEAARLLSELLPAAFPKRTLKIGRDGSRYKITGDLRT